MADATDTKKQLSRIEMITEFQCPGCSCGTWAKDCDQLKIDTQTEEGSFRGSFRCSSHHAGTIMVGFGKILLGMPVGFNKIRAEKVLIHLADQDNFCSFNRFNIPVWVMEKDGFLFVRVFCPRISLSHILVIQGETVESLAKYWNDTIPMPTVIDVSKFIDEID